MKGIQIVSPQWFRYGELEVGTFFMNSPIMFLKVSESGAPLQYDRVRGRFVPFEHSIDSNELCMAPLIQSVSTGRPDLAVAAVPFGDVQFGVPFVTTIKRTVYLKISDNSAMILSPDHIDSKDFMGRVVPFRHEIPTRFVTASIEF